MTLTQKDHANYIKEIEKKIKQKNEMDKMIKSMDKSKPSNLWKVASKLIKGKR